jgi:hypothetical protein
MGFKPGNNANPNGRPKGAKNKLPRDLVTRILAISDKLDSEGKGLEACAKENPQWFYENFLKPLLPKNVDVNFDGELTVKWQS